MIPELELQSSERIKSFQEAKLQEVVKYLNTRSPFYKNHFKRHGISIGKIQRLEDLPSIPTTTKDDLQQNNMDFLCVGKNEIADYASTSGTLGKPVTIGLTRNDLKRLAYNEHISFACAGASKDDLFQLMVTLDRQFMAGIAYYEGIHALGAGLIRTGPGLPGMQWECIQRLHPTALVAVPSFLVKLIDFAKEHKIDIASSSVKKVIGIGESFRTPDFKLNALGKRISNEWNIHLFGTYASTEMQTAFPECEHGQGGHLHPELLIAEVLDEENHPVDDGVPGELTITTIGVEGMPLLRYKTGDILARYQSRCACGRHTMRLGPVIGRKQQMIKLKGTTIYPLGIFDLLNDVPSVKDYVVETFSGDLGLDELKLHVLGDPGLEAEIRRTLQNAFQSRLRVVPEITFASLLQIEQMQLAGANRKLTRFIDRRKK